MTAPSLAAAGDEEQRRGVIAALLRLAREHDGPRLSLGALMDALDSQGFGLVILLLAFPNMVPGPLIPGFSVPFAFGIGALGVQMIMGFERPLLPQRLLRWSLSTRRFRNFLERMAPRLLRVERLLRPRPSWLTHRHGLRLVGSVLVLLSLVLALPVPFGNSTIGLGITIIALGLLENDGRALRWGLIAGVLAFLWNCVMIFAGAEIVGMISARFG